MPVVLVTGMSGTGKSTALAALARRGYEVVEMDEGDWSEWVDGPDGPEQLWREERVAELLDQNRDGTLFVSGCVRNQGRFYDRFDAVVLLSAPVDVLLERIDARTTNPFGKAPEERDLVVRDVAAAEPLLRATCTHELDATRPVDDVVEALAVIGEDARVPGGREPRGGLR